MLEIKKKTYISPEYFCSDLNRHPEWQIVLATDSVKPLKNPQIINGKLVDCEHCYTLFYKSDDCDEDETIPAKDTVEDLVEERKKDNNHILRHKVFDVSDRLCEAINQHPEWQIVQIVSKDGYLDLFYRVEDEDENKTIPADLAVWGLIEEKKKDNDPSLGILPHDEWNKLVEMVSELVKKAEKEPPEKSTK